MDQETAARELERLGATRWETYPPEAGVIRFLSDAGDEVARGRYQVILSYGPGPELTMAWAIGAYGAAGIPFVDRVVAGGPATAKPVSRDDAWRRGEQVARKLPGCFLYWCDTLLVAVSELTAGTAEAGPPAPTAERVEAMARAVARQQEPAEVELSGPEKRALLGEVEGLGPTDEQRTCAIFVIAADEQEVELSRDHVRPDDLPFFVRLYWMLPSWAQRTCLIQLVQDHGDDLLRPLWLDILRAPDLGPMTGRHAAKAIALAWLRGAIDEMMDYLDDYSRTLAHAATWLKTTPRA